MSGVGWMGCEAQPFPELGKENSNRKGKSKENTEPISMPDGYTGFTDFLFLARAVVGPASKSQTPKSKSQTPKGRRGHHRRNLSYFFNTARTLGWSYMVATLQGYIRGAGVN